MLVKKATGAAVVEKSKGPIFEVMPGPDGLEPMPCDGILQPMTDSDTLLMTNGDLRYEPIGDTKSLARKEYIGDSSWGNQFPSDFRLSQTRKIGNKYVCQWVKTPEDVNDATCKLDVFLLYSRKAAGTTLARPVGALCKAKGYTLKVTGGRGR